MWGDQVRYKINIEKLAKSLGFMICYQTFDRENLLGYINKCDMNIIVVSKIEKVWRRYAIADCLVHYLESDNQDVFYYEVDKHVYDDYFMKLTADLLIPTRTIKRLSKRKNNQELSEYFDVPLFLIERKLLDLKPKVKRRVK